MRTTTAPSPTGFGIAMLVAMALSACSSLPPPAPPPASLPDSRPPAATAPATDFFSLDDPAATQEMVIFALGLLDTGYKFGGRNPDAGLDCSGMVSYIVEQITGQRLPHNAARIADITRPIELAELQPGDLVFFNTQNRRHSHMGIYMGNDRFVHAPATRGRIRVSSLKNPYFKPRIDGARTLLAAN